MSSWVVNRIAASPASTIRAAEMLGKARQWLPEFLEGVTIDPETLHSRTALRCIQVQPDLDAISPDDREDEAVDCLQSEKAKRRVRGLKLLSDMADPDIFEWCLMMLEDASVDVRVAALKAMRRADEGSLEPFIPLAEHSDRRVRAEAIATATKFAGDEASTWFRRGLQDPSPCVRVEVARHLAELDPVAHRSLLELAVYDPNPAVAKAARGVIEHTGFAELVW